MNQADGANWWGLLALAVLIAGFGLAFLFLLVIPQRQNARALAALGARRGWTITRSTGPVTRGEGSTWRTRALPNDGAAWSCVVTFFGEGNRQIRTTEFRDPDLRLASGMVAIGPPLDAASTDAAARILGETEGLPSLLMERLAGDAVTSGELSSLQPVSDIGENRASVFAGGEADAQAVAHAVLLHLEAWRSAHPAAADFPIVIFGERGLSVRLRNDASKAEKLEAFVDYSLAVSQSLRGDP